MPSSARRVLLLALAGGTWFDLLVPGNAVGVNAVMVMAAFLGAALLVAGRDGLQRMDPADAWLAPAALAVAAMPALRADDWLVTLDVLVASALAGGAVAALAGGRVTRGLVPRVASLGVSVAAAATVGAGSVVRLAQRPAGGAAGPGRGAAIRRRLRPAAPVARGLLIALPVVAVFGALFASADAVFAHLASDVLRWQPDIDLEDLAGRAMVITVVAWGSAGLLAFAAGLLPRLAPADGVAGEAAAPAAPAAPPPPAWSPVAPTAGGPVLASGDHASGPVPAPGLAAWGPAGPGGGSAAVPWSAPVPTEPVRLGSVEAATILLVVDALFAAFVALQLAWLFGGRDTLAMTGFTYAEYARRGFFDLVIAAGLAGALVVTLDLAVARRARAHLAASLALLALTGVILVSAFLRLRLYQEAYGWTELRFVVLAAIGWLAVALAIAAGLLVARRTRWVLHGLAILTLVVLAGMNIAGPQAMVAEQNLRRAIDPALVPEGGRTGLDAAYLWELGDEAVVPIVTAWDRLGPEERKALGDVLHARAWSLANDPALAGWPAWNLTRERARDALRAWEAAAGTASR